MMVTLKTSIIGVHIFCFRAINEVARLIEEGLEIGPVSRKILERQLTAKRAGCKGGRVTQLVPEAKSRLHLFAELCQRGQVAPHEAHDLSEPAHTVLGLTHGLCGCRVDVNSESQQSSKIKAWPLTLIVPF